MMMITIIIITALISIKMVLSNWGDDKSDMLIFKCEENTGEYN